MNNRSASASAQPRAGAGTTNPSEWVPAKAGEPSLVRDLAPASAADLFPDVTASHTELISRQQASAALLEQHAAAQAEIDLRLNALVCSVNNPELQDARMAAHRSKKEAGELQISLSREYARLYRKHGAKYPVLIAGDALSLANGETGGAFAPIRIKTKSRGQDAAATKLAAADAITDPEILRLEQRQTEVFEALADATSTSNSLSDEMREGDAERLTLLREGSALHQKTRVLEQEALDGRDDADMSEALTVKAAELGIANAAIIDADRIGKYPIHQDEDGKLNVLAWNSDTGTWSQATAFRPISGNVTIGAELTLEDGSTDQWWSNVKDRGSLPATRRVAVIAPAPGARKLDREDGWVGLIATVDSSG